MSRFHFHAIASRPRGVRFFSTIQPKHFSTSKSPWDRLDANVIVTHTNGSPNENEESGGAVSWVTRNSKGDVLDQGTKWIPGETNSTRLKFHGLIEFTSRSPIIGFKHVICNDDDGVVTNILKASNELAIKDEVRREMSVKVWKQLEENFPHDTVLKYVPRSHNRLAAALADFARWQHIDKLSHFPCDHLDANVIFTHTNGTPDKYGKSGGAVSWVSRNNNGDVLDQGTKWISGETDPTRLKFHGLIEFTSRSPITGFKHIICSDHDGVVRNILKASNGHAIDDEVKREMSVKVWRQIQANFPQDTVLKYVRGSHNRLASALSNFARWQHVEKFPVVRLRHLF